MKINSIKLFVIAMSIFVTIAACTQSSNQATTGSTTVTAQSAPAEAKAAPLTKEECLDCHGPYEDLRTATLAYTTTDYGYEGDSIQPHIYLNMAKANHDSTEPANCTDCHDQHADPAPTEPVRTSMGYCMGCHHTGQLLRCSECHAE